LSREEATKIFCENLELLNKSTEWLKKSFEKAKNIDLSKEDLTEEELEVLETLANRFGRTIDILINKVLRGLDIIELEDIGRKLDIVIRAEKRGFIENYQNLIEMKDLRNEFFYESIQEKLREKFKEILDKTSNLIKVIDKVREYSAKMHYCTDKDINL